MPAQFLQGIQNPYPSILSFIESVNRQLNVSMATADPSTQFGTVTAARRNLKPFIIGLIPPDNAVNYVPIQADGSTLGPIGPSVPPVAGAKSQLIPGSSPTSTNQGRQPLVRTTVDAVQLRQDIYSSYTKLSGQAPSDNTVKLIWSQIAVENGKAPGSKTFQTNNYNLGNTHAGGKSGKYVDGFTPSYGKDSSAGIDPNGTFREPGKGTYYVGTDYDSHNQPYAVAYNAFSNQSQATNLQVSTLLKNWPDAASATNTSDFVKGLLPGAGKNYFEASPALYAKGIQARSDEYDKTFPSPIGAPSSGIAGNGGNSSVPGASGPSSQFNVMAYGSFNGQENTNIADSDRIGHNMGVASDSRQQVVAAQTTALQAQIRAIQATPPLMLLVNPTDFVRSYERAVDSGPKGRYRNIVHAWLERPLSISCTGVSAGQYVIDAEGNGGLTSFNRIYSLSYANLMSLVFLYRNNGMIYAGQESDEGIALLPMSVYIYFDSHIYIGSFDDFSLDDDSGKAFNMAYSFKFTSRYDLETDGASSVDEVAIRRNFKV